MGWSGKTNKWAKLIVELKVQQESVNWQITYASKDGRRLADPNNTLAIQREDQGMWCAKTSLSILRGNAVRL